MYDPLASVAIGVAVVLGIVLTCTVMGRYVLRRIAGAFALVAVAVMWWFEVGPGK